MEYQFKTIHGDTVTSIGNHESDAALNLVANSVTNGVILDRVHLTRGVFNGERLTRANLFHVTFYHCMFFNCTMAELKMKGVQFTDCVFVDAYFRSPEYEDLKFVDSTFMRTMLINEHGHQDGWGPKAEFSSYCNFMDGVMKFDGAKTIAKNHDYKLDLTNRVIASVTRSDGYTFMLLSHRDGYMVRAGCREYSMAEAWSHWRLKRHGTALGMETCSILEMFERAIQIEAIRSKEEAETRRRRVEEYR